MKKLIAAAAFLGLTAYSTGYAADPAKTRTKVDDATAQATADYATAKAQCNSVPERNRTNCLAEAKARYQAQLQGTKREHRDETPVSRDKPGQDKAAGGAR
jgi:hypothetical protein